MVESRECAWNLDQRAIIRASRVWRPTRKNCVGLASAAGQGVQWVILPRTKPQPDSLTPLKAAHLGTQVSQRTGHPGVAVPFDAAINCPQPAATSDHEASSSRQLTPRAPIPLSRPETRAPEEELSSIPRRPPTEPCSKPHTPPSTSHFEPESRTTTAHNGQQSPLLDRLRYYSPPLSHIFIGGPKG